MDTLKVITSIPNNAIIAFINDLDKKVYILQGTSVRTLIVDNIALIEKGDHSYITNLDNYRLEVIETCYDRVDRLLHTEYWIKQFESLGYEVLGKRCWLKYKYRIVMNHFGKIIITVVNRRNEQRVVGIFTNIVEARQFMEYSTDYSVIAYNQLTKKYMEKDETKKR